MIDEDEVHDGMTTDQPRRELIDSGTTAPPKKEPIAMWAVEALQSSSQQSVQKCMASQEIQLDSRRTLMKRICHCKVSHRNIAECMV